MSPIDRQQQKAATRQTILEHARSRFAEVGFTACTIRDVARAAGVSVGSVHVHFSDKRALLVACFADDIARTVAETWASLPRGAPLLEQLLHISTGLYRSYAERGLLSREMFRETLFPGEGEEADENIGPFLAAIVGLFERALDRGELRWLPEPPLPVAHNYFAAYLAVLVMGLREALEDGEDPRQRAARWGAHLRPLLALQLRAYGAADTPGGPA